MNKTKFLEVPENFHTQWNNNPKDWFNADLMMFTTYFRRDGFNNSALNNAYNKYCERYDLVLTPEDLLERFKDYSEDEIDEFMIDLIKIK